MKQANTAAVAVPKKKFSLGRALKRDWQLWVMILPAALYLSLIHIYPHMLFVSENNGSPSEVLCTAVCGDVRRAFLCSAEAPKIL